MTRAVAGAALPPALVVLLIAWYGVDVPYWDTWAWLARHYPAGDDSTTAMLSRYWALFNDHRVFVPLLLDRLLLWATGGNMLARALVKVPLSLAALWLFIRLARQTLGRPMPAWLPFALASLLFPLTYWPMWMDPRQFSVHLVALAMIVAVSEAAAPGQTSRRLVLSAGACAVATLSYTHGLFTWPCVALVLSTRRPRPSRLAMAVWALPGGVLGAVYLGDLLARGVHVGPAASPGVRGLSASVLALVGLPVAPTIPQLAYLPTLAIGACGIAALVWYAQRVRRAPMDVRRRAVPWLAIGGWALLTATITGWGRGGLPLGALHDPRFVYFTTPLWMAVVVLTTLDWSHPPGDGANRIGINALRARVIVCLVGLGYGVASLRPVFAPGGPGRLSATLTTGRDCLRTLPSADAACLAMLYPSPTVVREIAARLGPERLRVLRQGATQGDHAADDERQPVREQHQPE